MKKINIYIVTYNRLDLLKKTIRAIKMQNIFEGTQIELTVINNSSNDGTVEWLSENKINYISQSNCGGAGGFYKALEMAYSTEADYAWLMDDDVEPDINCLINLVNSFNGKNEVVAAAPLKIQLPSCQIFETDILEYNQYSLINKNRWKVLSKDHLISSTINIAATSFEGILIRINKELRMYKPLPEKEFFIWYDDVDFCLKLKKIGKLHLVKNALIFGNLETPSKTDIKYLYNIRNRIYSILYADCNKVSLYLINVLFILKFITVAFLSEFIFSRKINKKSIVKAVHVLKYSYNGIRGKLGKITENQKYYS